MEEVGKWGTKNDDMAVQEGIWLSTAYGDCQKAMLLTQLGHMNSAGMYMYRNMIKQPTRP
jgi:hypothetical protein